MLFSDKLEKIYWDNANKEISVLSKAFVDAFNEELQSAIGRGPQYDLKAHVVRINNAWKLFAKDKPEFKLTFFETLCKKAAPDVAKKIWPYDNKK